MTWSMNTRWLSRQFALDLKLPRSIPYGVYAKVVRGFRRRYWWS